MIIKRLAIREPTEIGEIQNPENLVNKVGEVLEMKLYWQDLVISFGVVDHMDISDLKSQQLCPHFVFNWQNNIHTVWQPCKTWTATTSSCITNY